MNKTIKSICETTDNDKVMEYAAKLIAWGGKKVRAVFTKKDGTTRTMICVPRNNWNEMNGIETTKEGLKMIKTKVSRGMATVCEVVENGVFQPRTLNLGKIISLDLV